MNRFSAAGPFLRLFRRPEDLLTAGIAIARALFCGQCHGIYTPPAGDFIGCSALCGSCGDSVEIVQITMQKKGSENYEAPEGKTE